MATTGVWLLTPTAHLGRRNGSRIGGEPVSMASGGMGETLRDLERQGFRLLLQVRVPASFKHTEELLSERNFGERLFCIFMRQAEDSSGERKQAAVATSAWRCVSFLVDPLCPEVRPIPRATRPLREKPAALAQFWRDLDQQAADSASIAFETKLRLEPSTCGFDAQRTQETQQGSEFVQESLGLDWQKEPEASYDEEGLTSDSEDDDVLVNEARLRLERCPRQCARYGARVPLRLSERTQRDHAARTEKRCKQCGRVMSFELQIFVQKCIFLLQRLVGTSSSPSPRSEAVGDDVESVDIYRCVHGCDATEIELQ